jgi:hypothetical protein
MHPTLTPHESVTKWRRADSRELPAAQEHSPDLCRLVGQPTHAGQDSTGQTSTYYFDYERKGRHKDLEQAFAVPGLWG